MYLCLFLIGQVLFISVFRLISKPIWILSFPLRSSLNWLKWSLGFILALIFEHFTCKFAFTVNIYLKSKHYSHIKLKQNSYFIGSVIIGITHNKNYPLRSENLWEKNVLTLLCYSNLKKIYSFTGHLSGK